MIGRGITVQRWAPASIASVALVSLLLVLLAGGPFVLGANAIDKLTTLFIYVILAMTWNALAGYAGLVSVGQQPSSASAPMARSGSPMPA